MLRRRIAVGATIAVVATGLAAAQLLPGSAPVARASGLTPYADCDALLAHYRSEMRASATAYGFGYGYGVMLADDMAGAEATGGVAARSSQDATSVGTGATGTNVQEQGVDEPDLAKLRDGRLVVLVRGRIQVVSAAAQPQVLGSLRLGGGDESYGAELLLVGDRAVAILPGFRPDRRAQEEGVDALDRSFRYDPGTPTTRLVLVDLSTDQPRLLEEATYDAQYVSARLVDASVRLVTTTRPQLPAMQLLTGGKRAEQEALAANQRTAAELGLSDVLPQVVRTDSTGAVLQRGNAVSCARVAHAENPRGTSTLLVTTMQPASGLGPTDNTAVTTDGDLVYASTDRLYVATSRWGTVGPVGPLVDRMGGVRAEVDEVTTELHGFDITSPTATTYVGTGSVPGYVLGRWALSEHEGALRVATTRQPPWDGESTGATSSMVVKLVERDGALVETGRVEGLGKTEQIRAVRYFGDVAAVVTFRQTDPLYLLDLSGEPQVLGELKVPGFSTYLHPIGDGKLLGLGQDADENGSITGVQMSVFDISDLSKPTLVDRLRLDYGYTPALDDSRAFSYDQARRQAVFAYTTYDPEGVKQGDSSALGVSVDAAGNLREVGRMLVDPSVPPSRVLVDGERVYAVGDGGVVAGAAESMSRTGAVAFAP